MNQRTAGLAASLLLLVATGAQALEATRSTAFEYDPVSGLLTAEIVEPNNPELCVRTSYVLDPYGNRKDTLTSPCNEASAQFASRTSRAFYDAQSVNVGGVAYAVAAGQFPTRLRNPKEHTETRQYDPRFGVPVSQTGPNELMTQWQYDDFGRKVLEIAPDGNRTRFRHCILPSAGDTSANSAGCATPSTAPSTAVSYLESQAIDSAGVAIGPYARKYLDSLGRTIREETQAYDGAGQPTAARLVVKDTRYNSYGAVTRVTQPYFIDRWSSLSAGGPQFGWVDTEYDELGRIKVVYTRDDEGRSYNGAQVASKTEFTYAGHIVIEKTYRTSKNAQGQQQPDVVLTVTKTSDPLGQVTEVVDSLSGSLRKRYDPFGNVIETQDALDNRIVTQFDTRGRKTRMVDPSAGPWNYRYNALGELTGQQSPTQAAAGQWTTMSYDDLGRMTARAEPTDYTTNWTYDSCTKGIGKLCLVTTDHGFAKEMAYDALGRPTKATQTVQGRPDVFSAQTAYDARGRVSRYTYPSGITVDYVYTPLGFLAEIRRAGTPIWRLASVNAWGQAEGFDLGDGSAQNTRQTFDPVTGRILSIAAGQPGSDNIMRQTYGWDTVGNVTDRSERYDDAGNVVTENFGYDPLNRLERYQTSSPTLPGLSKEVTLAYNAIGNIVLKSDVGWYGYAASGPGSVRPHAVKEVWGGEAGSRVYQYDAAGNMTGATGSRYSSLTYTTFNLPKTLTGAAATYAWGYGGDHERIRETKTWAGNTRVTWYFHPDKANGLAFEQEVLNGGTPVNRHYVSAMGRTIMVMESVGQVSPTGTPHTPINLQYWHADHLGSVVAITNAAGTVLQRFSYDPFGKRRHANGTYDAQGNLIFEQVAATGTDRGFTGHEHLDDVGLVHMNGRTYDPLIGRFMQTDPLVQYLEDAQSYNRYAYLGNNPLNAMDPTGHFKLKKLLKVLVAAVIAYYVPAFYAALGEAAAATAIAGTGFTCTAAGYATAASIMTQQAIVGGMVAGFASGAVMTGSIEGAMMGALTAGAFATVGATFAPGSFGSYAGHAVTGCVSGELQGGSCGRGAASAFVGKFTTVETDGWSVEGRFVAATVAGGTASAIGGGKFENGAITAAFGYLYNELSRGRIRYLFRSFKGHHPFTKQMANEFTSVMTDEAVEYVSRRTIGDDIEWDKGHPNRYLPETGHVEYNRDALEVGRNFIRDNNISKSNLMTVKQAAQLELELRRHQFNVTVQEYVNEQTRKGRVKLPGVGRRNGNY